MNPASLLNRSVAAIGEKMVLAELRAELDSDPTSAHDLIEQRTGNIQRRKRDAERLTDDVVDITDQRLADEKDKKTFKNFLSLLDQSASLPLPETVKQLVWDYSWELPDDIFRAPAPPSLKAAKKTKRVWSQTQPQKRPSPFEQNKASDGPGASRKKLSR
jgi:hypothetical protein